MALPIPMQNTYDSTSLDIDVQRTLNWFPNTKMGWRQYPGLIVAADYTGETVVLVDSLAVTLVDSLGVTLTAAASPSGDDRGALANGPGGLAYFVSGTSLFSQTSAGVSTFLGVVVGSPDDVGLATNGTQLMIVTGTTSYVYTISAGFQTTGDATIDTAFDVSFFDLKFIYVLPNGEFGVSANNDGTSLDSDDRAFTEWKPDALLGVHTVNQLIYLMGETSTEIWYSSGVGRPPIDRQNAIEYGIAGSFAKDSIDDKLYFIDHNQRPARLVGHAYESLWVAALGEEWQSYNQMSFDNARVQAYALDQENFIDFIFPNNNRVWTYHELTQSWFEKTFFTTTVIDAFNTVLAAGATSQKIYELTFDSFLNDTENMTRTKDLPMIRSELFEEVGKNMTISALYLRFSTSASTSINVSYSKDRGRTFSMPKAITVNGNLRRKLTGYGKFEEIIFRITTDTESDAELISAGIDAVILEG